MWTPEVCSNCKTDYLIIPDFPFQELAYGSWEDTVQEDILYCKICEVVEFQSVSRYETNGLRFRVSELIRLIPTAREQSPPPATKSLSSVKGRQGDFIVLTEYSRIPIVTHEEHNEIL